MYITHLHNHYHEMKTRIFRLLAIAGVLLVLLMPQVVFAQDGTGGGHHHGGEHAPSSAAGPLSFGFLAFGAAVIAVVGVILFFRNPDQNVSAQDFEKLKGARGYIGKMRLFSRNARLFMIHVVGMDVIYGSWLVLFNLYLLAVGFDVIFIGLRILIGSVASAVASIPAGLISDRIGRKLSFILGDGLGAAMSLLAISTANPTLLLATAAVEGAFGSLHGVAEPAFMAENSEDFERVHLFSVSGGTRTAAAIIGSAVAGLVPLMFLAADAESKIGLYRTVAYFGIGGWFASLIPALMLKQTAAFAPPATDASHSLFQNLFGNVRHVDRIWKLTAPEALIGLGAGFALPLMNVFFKNNLGSPEVEIGATFAAGETFLVVGSFLAPLMAMRLGKVKSVVVTRLASVPFILLIAFSPSIGGAFGSVLTVAGIAYVARITLMNMASPVRSAFGMEILHPAERGTQVGIQIALTSALSGIASFLGAQLMGAGDFRTPFVLMAVCYLLATAMFWQFFAHREADLKLAPTTLNS